ncbi:MAG: SpoIIE family protein phosphatase [Bacteroidetes bacterium]|jgi:serine phosphatase RsbU (regulator of sigma subunit)|nr:SpoIIE family protein phosphatase [Bacteroidota bacterium]
MLFGSRRTDDLERQVDALTAENERLRRAVDELSILNELAADIGATHDLEAIVRKIVRRSLEVVEAEQGVITMVDDAQEAGGAMKTLIRTSFDASALESLRPDEALLDWMRTHRRPLCLNAPRESKQFGYIDWPTSVRSLLCVPLSIRSRLIGLLIVYNKKRDGGFTEGDERLLSIIAGQSAQVIENARLHEEEKDLLRMREAMRVARDIQTRLLPTAAPDVPGYDLAGMSIPAQKVGGDYFDYIPVDAERLALCVGDVVGKGLGAALLMASVQAMLRAQTLPDVDVNTCLERANAQLHATTERGKFVSMVYGHLDTSTHHFRYTNAGHNRPLLRRRDGTIDELRSHGLVLGGMSSSTYAQDTVSLALGDTLLLYSDGLTEAMNMKREQFGEERLYALLREAAPSSAQRLLDHLLRAVLHFSKGAAQQDDITLLAVHRTGAPATT